MLDFHVHKIIVYLIERVVLFCIQETLIFEGVIMEIFSCLFDLFLVRASYFLLI